MPQILKHAADASQETLANLSCVLGTQLEVLHSQCSQEGVDQGLQNVSTTFQFSQKSLAMCAPNKRHKHLYETPTQLQHPQESQTAPPQNACLHSQCLQDDIDSTTPQKVAAEVPDTSSVPSKCLCLSTQCTVKCSAVAPAQLHHESRQWRSDTPSHHPSCSGGDSPLKRQSGAAPSRIEDTPTMEPNRVKSSKSVQVAGCHSCTPIINFKLLECPPSQLANHRSQRCSCQLEPPSATWTPTQRLHETIEQHCTVIFPQSHASPDGALKSCCSSDANVRGYKDGIKSTSSPICHLDRASQVPFPGKVGQCANNGLALATDADMIADKIMHALDKVACAKSATLAMEAKQSGLQDIELDASDGLGCQL
jgi:hypothetical protein